MLARDALKSISTLWIQLFSDENKHTTHLNGLQIAVSGKCT